MCGAASEYPQCFVNIDRRKASDELIERSLDKLTQTLRLLKPKFFFPSGGTYFIPGRFHKLNKFVAVPSYDQIAMRLTGADLDLAVECLEGGGAVAVNKNGSECAVQIAHTIERELPSMKQSIERHVPDIYDHDVDKLSAADLSNERINREFSAAKVNYVKALSDAGICLNARIRFCLHDTIELKDNDQIANGPTHVLDLDLDVKHETHELIIHIEKALFLRCLNRKAIWNQALSGSLCLFERRPNIFYPTDVFSLNYLVTR